jgi:hypothetical protein
MKKIPLILSLACLTSCAMYQQDFDCPPPCGVPCTSVTDLESMVLETNQGPDLFLPNQESTITRICTALNRKVWISDGCAQGYYIYQMKNNQ